ncbi:MAG: hypothetical protein OES26_17690 [Gammaproteobacteria bacterium]|nr:hypothetical protein [Gammaproteobacteria bacterium]
MKRLVVSMACLSVFGIASSAMAAPPGKSTILHCGCVVDAVGVPNMRYVEISVNSKTRGHDNHFAGTIDSCFDGVDTFTDFVRTGSDCQIDGPELGDPILACEGPVAGDICGAEVTQP